MPFVIQATMLYQHNDIISPNQFYHTMFIFMGDDSPSPPFEDRQNFLVETPSTSGGKHRLVFGRKKPMAFRLTLTH